MKIEISERHTARGTEYYEWSLWDGPEEIEHIRGYAVDLAEAFAKIFEWRERIANDWYREATEEEIENAKTEC